MAISQNGICCKVAKVKLSEWGGGGGGEAEKGRNKWNWKERSDGLSASIYVSCVTPLNACN